MGKQTICLFMIVRNEANVIARCLASVKRHIDHYAIVDTGSTDGTQDIIRRELAGVPGSVVDQDWIDFATNRNQSLELARASGCDFLMTLDADEELVWPEGKDIPKLTDDCYGIRFRLDDSEMTWTRTLLIRSSLPWRFVGAVHEYLDCQPVEPVKCLIVNAQVLSHTDGSRAGSDVTQKYLRDIEVLEKAIAADPENSRNWFYLGQSYCGAARTPDRELATARINKAIGAFERRSQMGGWDEEVFFSLFQIAALKEARGDHWMDVVRAHMAAYEARPTRAESLWACAVLCNDHEAPALAEMFARSACRIERPADCLLVMESVYEFRAADELAAALGRMRRYDEALEILEKLVALPKLPDVERQRAEENIAFIRGLKAA